MSIMTAGSTKFRQDGDYDNFDGGDGGWKTCVVASNDVIMRCNKRHLVAGLPEVMRGQTGSWRGLSCTT